MWGGFIDEESVLLGKQSKLIMTQTGCFTLKMRLNSCASISSFIKWGCCSPEHSLPSGCHGGDVWWEKHRWGNLSPHCSILIWLPRQRWRWRTHPVQETWDVGSIPGGGHGHPLQYSCLDSHVNRGAWQAAVHKVSKSLTWQRWPSTHITIWDTGRVLLAGVLWRPGETMRGWSPGSSIRLFPAFFPALASLASWLVLLTPIPFILCHL